MNNILGNAKVAYNQSVNIKYDGLRLLKEINNNISKNKNIIIKANEKDIIEKNGFKINFDIISSIVNESKDEKLYKSRILNRKENQITEYDSLGIIDVFFDGNTYILIEMAIKAIISHNAIILISQLEYMKNTNMAVCGIIAGVLKNQNINENIIQLKYDFDLTKYCSNDLIKKAFVIGNTDLHKTLKRISKIDTRYIGYNDCDVYIEDADNIANLEKMVNDNKNVLFKIYVNKSIEMANKNDIIYVNNIDEVTEKIKYDSCNYCCIIFSKNKENCIKFAETNKAKYIVINNTMDFNRTNNVEIKEFYCKKYIKK